MKNINLFSNKNAFYFYHIIMIVKLKIKVWKLLRHKNIKSGIYESMIFLFNEFLMSLFVLFCFLWVFVRISHLDFDLGCRLLLLRFLFVLIFDVICRVRFPEIKFWLGLSVTFKCLHVTIILLEGWSDLAFHLSLHSAVHNVLISDQYEDNYDKNNPKNYEPLAWM